MLYKKIQIQSTIYSYVLLLFLYSEIQVSSAQDYARLPENVEPIRYTLTITPYLDEKYSENKNFTFDGTVEIVFKVLEDTFNLTFHSEHLNINETSLYVREFHGNDSAYENIINQTMDTESTFYVIDFEEPLIKDNIYTVYIEYDGVLRSSMDGFYKASYKNKKNETKWMAMTHFSRMNARKAFPCFDEPALKSIFDIRIERLSNYTALSNMPLKMTVNSSSDGRVIDIFESTKKMSTYLVAWIITDFKNVTNTFGNHSIWANEDELEYTKETLEIAEEILKFMEEFLGIEYPLPKLDHVSVPILKPSGMENWGLITYRSNLLAYNPEEDTFIHTTGKIHLLTHEIAHQWFGDLVTCKWWNNLWLNEGIARYMEHKGLSQVKPHWHNEEHFILSTLERTLDNDETDKISAINDKSGRGVHIALSYEKSAVILRMVEHIVTTPVFRAGLQNYLRNM